MNYYRVRYTDKDGVSKEKVVQGTSEEDAFDNFQMDCWDYDDEEEIRIKML